MDKVFRSQAIPFILINEKQEDGKISYEFQLQKQACDMISALKNKKIAIATVAGPQRSGKSFLSNRLLKRMSGFAIGPSTMPCTKGLWIWGEPVNVSQDTVLIIMDTEGLNSVRSIKTIQNEIQTWIQRFFHSLFCCPLSSSIIRHIDEKALENMSYVLRITQNIRMKSQSEGDNEIAKCFPYFYWVLRDFSLDLKGMTETQYLQNALKAVSNDEKDPKNQIRAKIRKLFTFRRCECFPRPINDENKLAHIEELNFDNLREKFKEKMSQFQRNFFETLPVKNINGRPLTADIYLNLIREYIGAMNGGKVPQVLTSLQRVVQSEARQVTQGLYNNYKDAMNKIALPVDQNVILRNHLQFKGLIESKIDEKLKNWLDVGRTKDYKIKLLDLLQKDCKQRGKLNLNASDKACATDYSRLFQTIYDLPQMKSTDLVSDSYFKQKKNQFILKIKNFLEISKAPRKYTFLIEKFPKIYEYIQLLLARAKGVFNNQLNQLNAQSRNQQAELESLKRIITQQQNLLAEKQKEIDALTYQKDLLRRQYEKNEKMKELQIQSDKMSKNQIKKNLLSCKEQLIQLQNNNAQLEGTVQKLKAELSSKKMEISQMVKKTSEPEQSTDASTSLPNELLSTLSGLKDKLVNMKDFYDQIITDQNIEDNWMKQIEDQRTQKHTQIEKVKEKYTVKIAELRQKYNKNQMEFQRNIKLMNAHIDDLKTQNMDLQRQLNEVSDKRGGGNFSAERKNLQQSIRLKQNNINSLKSLNSEKEKKINELQFKLASINAQIAALQSYKQTFPFILSETLAWVQKKSNKLKHSIKTLSTEDQDHIRRIFKEANLNPF